jgi:tetratricopeptide (TPR) repeat protein
MGLGFALYRTGRLRQAAEEYTAVRSVLEAAPTLDTFSYPQLAGGLGRVFQAQGRSAEAEALIRRGVEVRDRTRGGTRMAAELREFLVPPLVALGRSEDAAQALAQAASIRASNALQPGTRAWGPHAVAAHELARARGDFAAAAQALDTLVSGGPQDPPDSLGWIDGTLLRARLDIDQGRLDDAKSRLGRLLTLLAERPLAPLLPLVEGRRLTLCAAVASRVGDAVQAARAYERAQRLYAVELGPQAPLQREWTALRAAWPPGAAASAAADAPTAATMDCG